MTLIIKDTLLDIEIPKAIVKIAYYTVNRTGFFEDGQPRFSVNLYLHFSNDGEIYKRKDISLDDLTLNDLAFDVFYKKMKEIEEFEKAKDSIPKYTPPVIVEDEEKEGE